MNSVTHSKSVLRLKKYLNVDGIDDIVSTVELSFSASSTNAKGEPIFASETIGVDIYSAGDPIDINNFTNFDSLSEEQVIEWALSKVSPSLVTSIENTLVSRLESQFNYVDVPYIPWRNIDMAGKVITTTIPWDEVNTTPDEKTV